MEQSMVLLHDYVQSTAAHLEPCQELFALLHTQIFHVCFPLLQQRPFAVCTLAVGQVRQLVGM